ncbi:hypothetical protein Tco_0584407 [Tanacetum coccineum]
MSFASSAVTYTSIYTDSEPGRVVWGADEEFSDGEPMHPEYIPLEDEHVFPIEEQPLPPVDSPTAESPGYVAESDPEEDQEEYEDDETKDGLVDYPMDEGYAGDDDDSDSSGDDADDNDEDEEDEDEEDDDEEEEHLAPAELTVVVTLLSPPEAEVERLLSMPTPSLSPPISLSPPLQGSTLLASTQALVDVVTAVLPLPPLPPLPPSLYIPPPVNRRDDIPKPIGGRGVDYGFVSTLDAEERRRGIREVGYGIRDTWVDPLEAVPEIAPMTVGEVNTSVIELAKLHKHDTQDLYALLEDGQDSKTRIS